jgi:hypothetical protein
MSRYPSAEVERFDRQFAEDDDERNERLRVKRIRQANTMFRDHSCWKCQDGTMPCVRGEPRQCEYPHARND